MDHKEAMTEMIAVVVKTTFSIVLMTILSCLGFVIVIAPTFLATTSYWYLLLYIPEVIIALIIWYIILRRE